MPFDTTYHWTKSEEDPRTLTGTNSSTSFELFTFSSNNSRGQDVPCFD
jgi:hypothetical protein